MAHRVAFLDVMDPKVQAEIRSDLPSGFAIQFGERGDRPSTWRWSPMPTSS